METCVQVVYWGGISKGMRETGGQENAEMHCSCNRKGFSWSHRSSGAGMDLQNCFKLRQWGQTFVPLHQPVIGYMLSQERGIAFGKTFSFSHQVILREASIQLWAISSQHSVAGTMNATSWSGESGQHNPSSTTLQGVCEPSNIASPRSPQAPHPNPYPTLIPAPRLWEGENADQSKSGHTLPPGGAPRTLGQLVELAVGGPGN